MKRALVMAVIAAGGISAAVAGWPSSGATAPQQRWSEMGVTAIALLLFLAAESNRGTRRRR